MINIINDNKGSIMKRKSTKDVDESTFGGINRCAPAQDVSYEDVLDDVYDKWRGFSTKVTESGIYTHNLDSLLEYIAEGRDLSNVNPGATDDTTYKDWNIRYQIKPKAGNDVHQAMAVHSKSRGMAPIKGAGKTADDAINDIKYQIDDMKGQNQIDTNKVNIDFNKELTTEIIGHDGVVYANIINYNGRPVLLLSNDESPKLKRATNRYSSLGKAEGTGQQVFDIAGNAANAAGLTHSRYTLGHAFDVAPGITGYQLQFHSDVIPGESIRMNEPGITVAYGKSPKRVNEVSHDLLKSYVNHAVKDVAYDANKTGWESGKRNSRYNDSDEEGSPREQKRVKGIARAIHKLSSK